MAERRRGPVRPPFIEGEKRDTDAEAIAPPVAPESVARLEPGEPSDRPEESVSVASAEPDSVPAGGEGAVADAGAALGGESPENGEPDPLATGAAVASGVQAADPAPTSVEFAPEGAATPDEARIPPEMSDPPIGSDAASSSAPEMDAPETVATDTALPESKRDEPPRPTVPPPVRPAPRSLVLPMLVSIVLGALLGAGIVYGLAYWGYMPTAAASSDVGATTLETRVAALENAPAPAPGGDVEARLAALEARPASTGSTGADLTPLENEMAALKSQLAAIKPADLAPMQTGLAALSTRLDALAANAPAADPAIAQLQQDLSGLQTRVQSLASTAATTETGLSGLKSAFETAQAEAAAAAAAEPKVDPAVELAMMTGQLQSAFANGDPFASLVGAVRSAAPDLPAPAEILMQRAETGLLTHAEMTTRLNDAVPDMLGARPTDPDAGLAGGAMDLLRSVLAVRPSGEPEGDGPDALVSRAETALAAQDYARAADLLDSLPPAMREKAGDLPAAIAARAEADKLIALLDQAIVPGAGGSQ